jgi:hypothetical protein
LPEQPGASYIPGCDAEGCPEYRAACRGDDSPKGPDEMFAVESCLHPNTLTGPAVFQGLGPKWIRLILYNWGGYPDTTEGAITITLNAPAPYYVRTWLPPRAKYERNFCAQRPKYLQMPPPGEQYEVLLEVGTYNGSSPHAGTVAINEVTTDYWDQEIVVWRQYNPDIFYTRCHLVSQIDELGSADSEFFTADVCVDGEGRFVDTKSGDMIEGFPDLSVYPTHADPKLEDCDTWQLLLEYADEE